MATPQYTAWENCDVHLKTDEKPVQLVRETKQIMNKENTKKERRQMLHITYLLITYLFI